MIKSNAKSLLDNTALLYKQTASSGIMCVWIKGHLSAKSVKIVAIFYVNRGKTQILSSLLPNWKNFYCYPARCVCLSCLESNDILSFPRLNIHNRHFYPQSKLLIADN